MSNSREKLEEVEEHVLRLLETAKKTLLLVGEVEGEVAEQVAGVSTEFFELLEGVGESLGCLLAESEGSRPLRVDNSAYEEYQKVECGHRALQVAQAQIRKSLVLLEQENHDE